MAVLSDSLHICVPGFSPASVLPHDAVRLVPRLAQKTFAKTSASYGVCHRRNSFRVDLDVVLTVGNAYLLPCDTLYFEILAHYRAVSSRIATRVTKARELISCNLQWLRKLVNCDPSTCRLPLDSFDISHTEPSPVRRLSQGGHCRTPRATNVSQRYSPISQYHPL